MSYIELFQNHLPDKYLKLINDPNVAVKIHRSTDSGLAAYHGEEGVEHVTYEFNNKTFPNTIIMPALINTCKQGKLSQISVIVHF
jgi:hypothetical protein